MDRFSRRIFFAFPSSECAACLYGSHPVVLPHLKVRGIDREDYVGICQRTVPEFIDVSIQVFADFGNSRFRK